MDRVEEVVAEAEGLSDANPRPRRGGEADGAQPDLLPRS